MHVNHTTLQTGERFAAGLPWKGLFAIVVWGASFVATRIALECFSPFGLVASRLLAGVLLLGVLVRLRGGAWSPARADWPRCVLLGVVLSTHMVIQAYGLQYTSAINTGWIIGFAPVTIALGAHAVGQQRLTPMGWLGVLAGAGGVLFVTLRAPPDFSQAHFGDLLQVTSCVTWAVYTLASTRLIARYGALRTTAWAMGVAAVLVTLVATAQGVLSGPVTRPALIALAFLGVVCSGLAYSVWFSASYEHGPARVAALLYLEPFVTLGAAATILAEPVTPNAVLGGLTVLAGVWLVARGARAPGV